MAQVQQKEEWLGHGWVKSFQPQVADVQMNME